MSTDSTGALEGPERLLGQRVLDFELKAVLGAGGMSVVYRGEHRVTAQEVAIKILPPELAVHDDLKARFVEEARVLARLDHPNIVALNNFIEAGGRLCLVMSYVAGTTFENMIVERGKVAPDEAVRVGLEVLKALEYAHAQNVIHRDIKPSNVLVRPDGVVKVTDFGIAKILGQTRLTSTGQTMGTVRYMSPEQVRGRALDARSDLYSLGITLYEALAGQTPFDGENQFEIMQQQISKAPPPLASFGAEVPHALERVLRRALEKDPKERFADAVSFRQALTEIAFATDGTVPDSARAKRAASPARSRRTLALVLGAGVAMAGAGAAVYFVRAARPQARPRAAAPATAAVPAKPSWPSPHAIPGLALAIDRTYPLDGLRVQSAAPRNADRLRERYLEVTRLLREFLTASTVAAARDMAAHWAPPPLTLTIVPQALLNRADLWPGHKIEPDKNYPSRYIEPRQTLFVADTPGFERRDLAFGVALHVLAPNRSLSTDQCYELADQFEAYYLAHASR